jgi:hypothetical protein
VKESDVRKAGEEQERPLPDVSPAVRRDHTGSMPESGQGKADDEWLAFAAEDPAFFIKPSDTA